MPKSYNMLENYEWLGEFWFENDVENSMPGILSYSPKSGILLKITYFGFLKNIDRSKRKYTLFGKTKHTGNLTLLSAIPGSLSYGAGINEEILFCETALIGGHFSEKEMKFQGCKLKFNNLDEFCHPQGFPLDDSYIGSSLFTTELDNKLIVSLDQETIANPCNDITNLFIEDKKVKKEINNAIKLILKKYDKTNLDVRKEISYHFFIKKKAKKPVGFKIFKNLIWQICDLFTLLMQKPIYPEEILLLTDFDENEHRYKKRHYILKTLLLNDKDIIEMKNNKSHQLMPVNLTNSEKILSNILKKWYEFSKKEFNIISQTLLGGLRGREFDYLQRYLLLIASIERWQIYETGEHQKGKSCEWFLKQYSCASLNKRLRNCFPKNEDIHNAMTYMRNIIAHPEKLKKTESKKYIYYFNEINIMNICELIAIIFIRAIYKYIGISRTIITKIKKPLREYY